MKTLSLLIEKINILLSPLEKIITQYLGLIKKIILGISFLSLLLIFIPDMQRDIGEQAQNVLLCILFLPIAARVGGLSLAQALMPLRKEAGILMGVLAWVHGAGYIFQYPDALTSSYFWWQNGTVSYLAMGLIALLITTPLFLTSNEYAIKLLGKKWKLVHKMVYLVIIFTILHIVLIQWAQRNSIDYGTLTLLAGYFIGKILEWKGYSFGPKKTYAKGQKFLCVPCGYIYDPTVGDIEDNIAPGTEFVDIPDSWRCPVCGVTKADFVPYEADIEMPSYAVKVIEKTLLNPTTLEIVIETETFLLSRPGQFITWLFEDTTGEFQRSYSIVAAEGNRFTCVIKLTPHGRGATILSALEIGDTLKIRGVFGEFLLAHTVAPKIFIATGTGLAPILNMIGAMGPHIPKSLYFSVATEADLFYVERLRAIPDLDLHIHVTQEEVPGCEFCRVDIESIKASEDTEWYLCGNPKMVIESEEKLSKRNYTHIHTEVFR